MFAYSDLAMFCINRLITSTFDADYQNRKIFLKLFTQRSDQICQFSLDFVKLDLWAKKREK